MKKVFALLVFVLAACNPTTQPPDAPGSGIAPIYAPRAGDELLLRGEVYIDSADLLAMESFPVQYSLALKGNLPTPCHELRAVFAQPDSQNRIYVEVYSLADPNAVCVAMLQPFEQSIYLGTFPAGHYTVWVNGRQMAEFVE